MSRSDLFILADNVSYSSHSMINRCRIKSASGAVWLTVPVLGRGRSGQLICDTEIDPHANWARKHWKSLALNYRYSPYFEYYAEGIQEILFTSHKKLAGLNTALILHLTDLLKLNCRIDLGSRLAVEWGTAEKIVALLQHINYQTYLTNPESGKYLNSKVFERAGLALNIDNTSLPAYHQQFGKFIPDLSILDLLFNLGPEARRFFNNSK